MLKRKLGQKGADGRGNKMQTSLRAGRKAVIFSRWEKGGEEKDQEKEPLDFRSPGDEVLWRETWV